MTLLVRRGYIGLYKSVSTNASTQILYSSRTYIPLREYKPVYTCQVQISPFNSFYNHCQYYQHSQHFDYHHHDYSTTTRPIKPSPSQLDPHMEMGVAIRVLRDELETFFVNGLTNTSIYASDIQFYDPRYTHIHVYGLGQYLPLFRLTRILFHLWFSEVELTIVGIQQRLSHPNRTTHRDESQQSNNNNNNNNNNTQLPADVHRHPPQSLDGDKNDIEQDESNYDDGILDTLSIRFIVTGTSRWSHLLASFRTLTLFRPSDSTTSSLSSSSQSLVSSSDSAAVPLQTWEATTIYAFNKHTGKVQFHWIDKILPHPHVWRIGGWIRWTSEAARPNLVTSTTIHTHKHICRQ